MAQRAACCPSSALCSLKIHRIAISWAAEEQRDDKACHAMCTLELIQAFSSNLSFEQFEH